MQTDAAAGITAKTLATRKEVQKAAEQRQLPLAMRAERQAAAQADTAARANTEATVLSVTESDQLQQDATAGGEAAQEEKLAQAVWDTSDLSGGGLEPAAFNPYAGTSASQAISILQRAQEAAGSAAQEADEAVTTAVRHRS